MSVSLDKLREQIDETDDKIVSLLSRRAELVLEVKKAKARDNMEVYSPSRERQILDRVLKLAEAGKFPLPELERIFVNIISASRSLMGELQVAYLGPDGSFALEASLKQFGEAVHYFSAVSIDDVIDKVQQNQAQYGVLPLRTGTSVLVQEVFELLDRSTLSVIAEIELGDSRYAVVGPIIPKPTGNDKTSVLCAVKDRAGVLHELLAPLAASGVTLLNIESRPTRNRDWQYVFFIDVLGHISQAEVEKAVDDLGKLCAHLKVLGSYPMVCQY